MAPYFSPRVPNFFFANYCNFPCWLFVRVVRDNHRVQSKNASLQLICKIKVLCKSFLIITATSVCQDRYDIFSKVFFSRQRVCFLINARHFLQNPREDIVLASKPRERPLRSVTSKTTTYWQYRQASFIQEIVFQIV